MRVSQIHNHIQIKDVKVKGTTIEVSASKANPPGVAHMRHLKRKHKKTLRRPLIMSAPERGEGSSLSLSLSLCMCIYIYIDFTYVCFYSKLFLKNFSGKIKTLSIFFQFF